MATEYKPFKYFEPSVAFRYKITSSNLAAGDGYLCKAVGLPKLEQGEVVIDYINTDFKVKGKSRWQDITVTMYNPVNNSDGAKAVHDWIKKHHNSIDGTDGFYTGYKEKMTIEVLSPSGTTAQTWDLFGAFISSVNWGDMDWSGEDANTIELTIKYDYAVLSKG